MCAYYRRLVSCNKSLDGIGYHMIRKDRTTARGGENAVARGGGLAILVRNDIQASSKLNIVDMSPLNFGKDTVTEVSQVKLL